MPTIYKLTVMNINKPNKPLPAHAGPGIQGHTVMLLGHG